MEEDTETCNWFAAVFDFGLCTTFVSVTLTMEPDPRTGDSGQMGRGIIMNNIRCNDMNKTNEG